MVSKKRLIDANEPINAFKRYSKNHPNATWNAFGIEEVINAAKIVDAVEVAHGRWVHHYYDSGEPIDNKWYCSECAMCNDYKRTWYCPHCGAKMDGERRDNND